MTFRVDCDKGCSYTQDIDTNGLNSAYTKHPVICGACGSKDIRVWAMVYDALTIAIKDRLEKSKPREGWQTDINGPGYVERKD